MYGSLNVDDVIGIQVRILFVEFIIECIEYVTRTKTS